MARERLDTDCRRSFRRCRRCRRARSRHPKRPLRRHPLRRRARRFHRSRPLPMYRLRRPRRPVRPRFQRKARSPPLHRLLLLLLQKRRIARPRPRPLSLLAQLTNRHYSLLRAPPCPTLLPRRHQRSSCRKRRRPVPHPRFHPSLRRSRRPRRAAFRCMQRARAKGRSLRGRGSAKKSCWIVARRRRNRSPVVGISRG